MVCSPCIDDVVSDWGTAVRAASPSCPHSASCELAGPNLGDEPLVSAAESRVTGTQVPRSSTGLRRSCTMVWFAYTFCCPAGLMKHSFRTSVRPGPCRTSTHDGSAGFTRHFGSGGTLATPPAPDSGLRACGREARPGSMCAARRPCQKPRLTYSAAVVHELRVHPAGTRKGKSSLMPMKEPPKDLPPPRGLGGPCGGNLIDPSLKTVVPVLLLGPILRTRSTLRMLQHTKAS